MRIATKFLDFFFFLLIVFHNSDPPTELSIETPGLRRFFYIVTLPLSIPFSGPFHQPERKEECLFKHNESGRSA